MTDWMRVRDKSTGHKYSLPASAFNEKAHVELKQDALAIDGRPLPPEYATPSGAANSGQKKADTTPKKEND